MRIDDDIHARRIAADRFEPRADLLARIKADPEQRGEAGAEATLRIMPASGRSSVSNNAPFGCSIRKTGTGIVTSPSPPVRSPVGFENRRIFPFSGFHCYRWIFG
jgi:hypothetical protein